MNAIQFIQQHGVEKAREVVEGAPEGSTHFVGSTYLKLIGAVWWNAWLPEWSHKDDCMVKKWKGESIDLMKTWGEVYKLDDLKRLVESVDIINKFDSVQEAKDAISNAPEGATDYRKLSCTIRYIKQSERFFEYWDGFNWCRPTVPFTDETHILRFTQLSRLEQAIADYELLFCSGESK